MRAAIYTRVSVDKSGRARSVEEQERDCRATAAREGWDVAAVFSDNDRSASRYATKGRPDWARAVEFIEAGKCDVLITWEASRSTRDLEVYVKLRELCRRRDVLWSYSGRTFDLSRYDDRLTTGLDVLLAERESDMTRERVLRAVRAAAEAGKPHGRLLYGYRREYAPNPNGKPFMTAQVPDEREAPIVQEAVRRVLAGETCYAVAQDFNERGIPTPRNGKRWDLTQVRRLCVNPGYIGKRVHKGEVVGDAIWPAIVDEADHLALVSRLSDPARRTQRDSAIRHLMSGIAVCGTCGGTMRILRNRGTLAYTCIAGQHLSRKQEPVDELIEAVMIERLKRLDLGAILDVGDGDAREAAEELRLLRARLDSHYDAAAAGEITAAALARIEPRVLALIDAAEKRLAVAHPSPLLAEVAGPDAGELWAGLDLSQKRELIRLLMDVRILKAGAGKRVWDPSLIEITWK